jgi:hypothetical protein
MASRAGADFCASLSRSAYEFRLRRSYTTNHGELSNTATMRGQIARFLRKRTVSRPQRENRQFNPKRIDLFASQTPSLAEDRHLPSTASSSPRRSRRPFLPVRDASLPTSVTGPRVPPVVLAMVLSTRRLRALRPDRDTPIANYRVHFIEEHPPHRPARRRGAFDPKPQLTGLGGTTAAKLKQ